MTRAVLAILATAAVACGEVSKNGSDGGIDAAIDGTDVPGSPVVEAVEPRQLFENLGSGTGARAIPIVVIGSGFAADAALTAEPPAALLFEGPTVVAADGTFAARLARVPLATSAGAGMTTDVTVVVTQGAGLTGSGTIEIEHLDELAPAAGNLDVATLAARYSQITIAGTVTLTGTTPGRLVATGDVSINAIVNARSGSCLGGNFGVGAGGGPGGCSAGGGRGGAGTASGGGGGGNATAGAVGGGIGGGAGGQIVGNEMVVPFGGTDGNRGNGGGGGGGANEGGGGGHGGGVVEIAAGGRLLITGEVSADGGRGSDGDAGSGGGGGSGGVILLRAGGSLEMTGSVHARGGPPGLGEGDPNGGAGGVGRIRADAPQAQLPAGFLQAPNRGPMWPATTPAIVTNGKALLGFHGGNRTYFVSVNGGAPAAVPVPGANNLAEVNVTLAPGLNTVCAHAVDGATAMLPEAQNCLRVAYLPE